MLRYLAIPIMVLTLLQTFCGEGQCKTIAAMLTSDLPRYRDAHRAFVKTLAAQGYSQPGTEILLQTPNPDQLSWSNTVRKFNALRPAFIVAYGTPAAMTAMKESDGLPVLSVDYYGDPATGSFGVGSRIPIVTMIKTLQSIKAVRRLGVIYSSKETGSLRQLDDLKKLSRQNGITIVEGNAASAIGVDSAVSAMIDRVDAVFVTESTVACRNFDRIVSRTRTKSIPVISPMPDAAERGAVVSLEINPQEQGAMAAELAARLLSGTSPENLSLAAPKRIDLILNLSAAREMGISIPFQVLSLATRVIK